MADGDFFVIDRVISGSYLWPRFKQYVAPSPAVCASARTTCLADFCFEPALRRSGVGRSSPGPCPIVQRLEQYGKG